MKTAIKHKLSRLGILHYLDSLRMGWEKRVWLDNGCKGTAPPPVKRKILLAYMRQFGLNQFVETGTYLGDTLAYIAQNKKIQCTSIELADEYYEQAKVRFQSYHNVKLLHGDSGTHIAKVVTTLYEPALF